jgi:ABC-type thiamin/hydroxymethylpyrimidine transport system permease subunit
VSSALYLLVRAVKVIVGILVALIVLGILFALLEANPRNGIVSAVNDIGRALVGPFEDLFTRRRPKEEIAINWGIAAVVYLVIGSVIATLLGRVASAAYSRRGRTREREPGETRRTGLLRRRRREED